jgi:hypothetical protein
VQNQRDKLIVHLGRTVNLSRGFLPNLTWLIKEPLRIFFLKSWANNLPVAEATSPTFFVLASALRRPVHLGLPICHMSK